LPDTLTFDNMTRASFWRCRRVTYRPTHYPGDPALSDRADLLQGTLDLLILKSLVVAPLHGWGISKRIRELSRDVLQVNQGSLYPALYRLEDRGWVESEWGISPEGRRAKFYALTSAGRKQIATEQDSWRRFSLAIEQVLAGSG
jgi:PadR family transcriptional regulator, regulatory protein PadR